MAYGTPRSPDDVEEYYTHIRRGRAPAPEQLADLVRRYDAIGGVSPMRRRTEDQVTAITGHLNRYTQTAAGSGFEVRLGQKHAAPFIEDGVDALIAAGVSQIIGLVLAPHYSSASVGQYHDRARSALAASVGTHEAETPGVSRIRTDDQSNDQSDHQSERPPTVAYHPIDDWSMLPSFIDFTAAAVRRSLTSMPERTMVCFTAHSLPLRVLETDPYEQRLKASAAAIATAADIHGRYRVTTGWQSAGRTPEAWATPDILEIIRDVAADPTLDGLLVVPQGFTSDHLEVRFDLDIEARTVALDEGVVLARTDTINDDPRVMTGLAELIQAELIEE